jgi:imidazolonepropionase
MSENLIIFNARIVTPTGTSARKGAEMGQLRIIENGTVEVTKGIITYVGESRGEDRDGYYQHYWHYNARGHCLSIRIPILFLAENVPKNFHGG